MKKRKFFLWVLIIHCVLGMYSTAWRILPLETTRNFRDSFWLFEFCLYILPYTTIIALVYLYQINKEFSNDKKIKFFLWVLFLEFILMKVINFSFYIHPLSEENYYAFWYYYQEYIMPLFSLVKLVLFFFLFRSTSALFEIELKLIGAINVVAILLQLFATIGLKYLVDQSDLYQTIFNSDFLPFFYRSLYFSADVLLLVIAYQHYDIHKKQVLS